MNVYVRLLVNTQYSYVVTSHNMMQHTQSVVAQIILFGANTYRGWVYASRVYAEWYDVL